MIEIDDRTVASNSEGKPAQTSEPKVAEYDAHDKLLDNVMLSEGCPNAREDD